MAPESPKNLIEAFLEVVRERPQGEAIIAAPHGSYQQITLTYERLGTLVRELEKILRERLTPASVVAIVMSNGAEFVVAFLAVIAAGLVAAPHNPVAREEELDFFLQDIGASLVLTAHRETRPDDDCPSDDECHRLLLSLTGQLGIHLLNIRVPDGKKALILDQQAHSATGTGAPSSPDDASVECPPGTALLLHTSGTTAKPKLVPILSTSLALSVHQLATAYEIGPRDILLLVMPLFHVHGLIGNLLTCLLAGASVVLPGRFSATHFLEVAAAFRVTWFSAVPTIYQILYANPKQYLRSEYVDRIKMHLRFIRSCSAAMPTPLLHRLMGTFGVPVVQAYGMTESTHMGTTGTPSDPGPLGSVGRPLPGRTLKILNPDSQGRGEICLRGPGMLEGYLKPRVANTTAFTDDGFFRTGDLGYTDEGGYLFVAGRIKELINRGGEKINPHEVENVLLMGPVREAVCFALPDTIYGEQVAAVIVPEHSDQAQDLEKQLSGLCHEHLSAFKCPTRLFVVQEIPKSAIGKIQRAYLTRFFSS